MGEGHVYQGRYKSFPIESDGSFYHVVRYVEANALRARLVTRPDAWQWSSLWRRERGDRDARAWLSQWPAPRPRDWLSLVARAQPKSLLASIRTSLRRGQPYGSQTWIERTAELNLESTLRPRGRPRKSASELQCN